MAIEIGIPVSPVSQPRFDAIDKVVMQCAYASQNHFGRLCEEQVYENDLKARLKAEGILDIHSQVELKVSYEGFVKRYRLDLIADQMIYELKAKDRLVLADEAQALNYAALLGLNRVKLINFGGSKVIGKLVGAPFADLNSKKIVMDTNHWFPIGPACENLAGWVEGFMRDVGGYLRSEFYDEALIWFCGGHGACIQRLPVRRGELDLGHHACRMYADHCAFVVTGLGDGAPKNNYLRQLRSLLNSLPIQAFQWINVHHLDVSFTTVLK